MYNQIKKLCCLLSILIISNLCYGQKQFHITIQFEPKLDSTEFLALVDDGKGASEYPIRIKDGKIEIKCNVYSKYAYLSIYSPSTKNQKSYFITKEASSITFYGKNKSAKDYPFVNGKLINAVEIINTAEAKKLQRYVQKEQEDFTNFNKKNGSKLRTNDSLMSIYSQKEKKYEKKCLDYIRLNSNQYFCLWVFNIELKNSKNFPTDSLLGFYKDVLYPKYKNLFEAKQTFEYLSTPPSKRKQYPTDYYALNPLLKINQMAPDFTARDMSGKKISLSQLRGKYVLLNFWATWCGPCVRELPLFNKLKNDFPEDQLEIISISEDRAKADCEKGIKEYGLNWTNIYQDKELISKYKVFNGIPSTFLIDKEEKLVFMHVGSLSNTDELRKLLN
jgi:peroxiredoxin